MKKQEHKTEILLTRIQANKILDCFRVAQAFSDSETAKGLALKYDDIQELEDILFEAI